MSGTVQNAFICGKTLKKYCNSKKDVYLCTVVLVFNIFVKLIIMTKAEIVNEIAKSVNVDKTTVQAVVDEFTKCVKDSLAKGNPVYIRGFGSFIIKHRAEKAARNITKNTTMTIPAHDVPAFKPAKVFVNVVKK